RETLLRSNIMSIHLHPPCDKAREVHVTYSHRPGALRHRPVLIFSRDFLVARERVAFEALEQPVRILELACLLEDCLDPAFEYEKYEEEQHQVRLALVDVQVDCFDHRGSPAQLVGEKTSHEFVAPDL